MAKFPYLTSRNGSNNLYYKRLVPTDLRMQGRPQQIWRSLGTSDRNKAKKAYAKQHAEVELLFDSWRRDDEHAVSPPGAPTITCIAPTMTDTPLTPALLRRLSDAHYLQIYEDDFEWRGSLWTKAQEDEEAFWRGDIIAHPTDDWQNVNGKLYSYYACLMEEPTLEDVFLYCIFTQRKSKLRLLRRQYQLGASTSYEASAQLLLTRKNVTLTQSGKLSLIRELMKTAIRALEDLTAADETTFNRISSEELIESTSPSLTVAPSKPCLKFSDLLEKYLETSERERQWPRKTVLRQRAALQEFLDIVGDKPANSYTQADGVRFKDVQFALPNNRQKPPFRGLTLTKAAEMTKQLGAEGKVIPLLNPLTIKDKIGMISLFFLWAQSREQSVVNPLANQQLRVARKKTLGKKRHPWAIEELNLMFAAPIYTGCRSEYFWKEPGPLVLRQSAKFWVPLIALFSGMRLGEIIQLRVADIKTVDNIKYFDVTPIASDPADKEADEIDEANEKSLKTSTSRRGIPVHNTLLEIGFEDFLEQRRKAKELRLFPEYEKALDDGSWSKQFSKHFKRFRDSLGITRQGVKFHSLRHNVEDALRNANVRQEIRDAIQGHGENGVSREYGTGYYVGTLNEALQQIHYEGLELQHLSV